MAALTRGDIKNIHTTGNVGLTPVLQVMDVKRIGGADAAERYRIIISDGEHYQQAMLATQQNAKVKEGGLEVNATIRLVQYICNTIQNKKIIIIINLEVVEAPRPRIGNPLNVENGKTMPGGAPAAAAPAAPPQSFAAKAPQASTSYQKPMQQSTPKPFNRGPSRPVSHASPVTGRAQPIASLNPYRPSWTIKAIINSKNKRTYKNARGGGFFVTFEFKDDSGRIKAICFNDDAERLDKAMEMGKTYMISKGQIKPAKKQYCDFHDYEITLGRETVCSEVTEGAMAIQYEFVKIAALEQKEPNSTVDIVGVAQSVSEVAEITSKKDGRQLQKRNIQLVDDSNASVELTLWGDEATKFPATADGAPPPVVVIRGAYVSEWGGRSLGARGSTTIMLGPDMAEVHATRAWFDTMGKDATATSLSSGGGGGGNRGPNTENRMGFAEAEAKCAQSQDKKCFYNNYATVTLAKQDGTIAYPSCPETKKKLIELGPGEWKCEATGKTYPEPQWRYCLSLKAEDATGHQWMTAFDAEANIIVGKEAKDVIALKEAKDSDPAADAEFSAIFDNINGKDFIFRCVMKEEVWQDEARMKTSILGCDAMDYAAESNHILSTLASQYGVTC